MLTTDFFYLMGLAGLISGSIIAFAVLYGFHT